MEDLIREIIKREIPLTLDIAKVIALKGDVCHVESLTTEKDFFKCRLNAIETNDNDKLKLTPSKGSTVVIGIFPNTEKAVVLNVSEVDQVEFVKGNTKFTINESGYDINRNGKNLNVVLNKVLDAIVSQNEKTQQLIAKVQSIVVIQGVGPDVIGLNQLSGDISQLITTTNNELRQDLSNILINNDE